MPLRNRINPFGELVATPHRGELMGNRGVIHDARRQICRPFAGTRWILCVLDFKGRRRVPMTPGQYTELFFLDEATGLAAGHRPCFECQRDRATAFRAAWAAANPALAGSPPVSAIRMDATLHADRLDDSGRKRIHAAELAELPPGVMVQLGDDGPPLLVLDDGLRPWGFDGYGPLVSRPGGSVGVLTPASVVRALARGYPVGMHPTATGPADFPPARENL